MKNIEQKEGEFNFKRFLIEFFRPNKWKIIMLFILIIITLLSAGRYACYGGTCIQTKGLKILYEILIIIDNKLLESLFPDSFLLILELIYLYSLSCLSFFLISKIKENVKNK